ncbi:MAG: RnfABCDGE type electron transport complex subunit D, partial [Planctomycetota bacterium]
PSAPSGLAGPSGLAPERRSARTDVLMINTHSPTTLAPTVSREEIRKRHTLILISLIPAIACGCFMFGWWPPINFVVTWIVAMLAGTLFKKVLHHHGEPSGYRIARCLSSVLLVGCLPPNLPWWGAVIGGFLIDFFSRLNAHAPRWSRWFRHISPVVPALAVMYLAAPVVLPGLLYQPNYPILVHYDLHFGDLMNPTVTSMLRDPRAGAKAPPFTWDIQKSMPETDHDAELNRGILPPVDAVSRPSPMAIVRAREPIHHDAAIERYHFDVLDGLLGWHSGATLEVSAMALLFGIFLLCLNRILPWRFVVTSLVGTVLFGFLTGGWAGIPIDERLATGMEHLLMGGLLLSLFLFAHPVGLPVSKTASYLQGLLLSLLVVLFRRLLWRTDWNLYDATLVAILISALVLPTLESFTRRHGLSGTPAPAPPGGV